MKKLMKVSAAMMIFLLPMSMGNVQAAVADNTSPVFLSIESDKTILAPGEKITFSVGIEDESEIDYANVNVKPIHRSISGSGVRLNYDPATKNTLVLIQYLRLLLTNNGMFLLYLLKMYMVITCI